jgi:hypothetical protein
MKRFYPFKQSFFCVFLLVISLSGTFSAKAQFTTAGDIAFTGYISALPTNVESFSFVLLKNIPAGSTLNFTDRGWNGAAFNATTESGLTWTTGSALVAGREVTISGLANNASMTVVISGSSINAGSVSGTMVNLATSGDQILAYVGSVSSPTFIAGIHMNSYNNGAGGSECGNTTAAAWDNATNNACVNPGNANSSALPSGLTGGSTAVFIGVDNTFNSDFDNAVFNCTGALATAAQVRASVNTYTPGSNWTTQNAAPAFTLPSGCAYLASIFPVDIISFTGSSQTGHIGLNWQTANEPNDNGRYELEKSADGQSFTKIVSINAQGYSFLYNNYDYKDYTPLRGANFYRLKIVSPGGSVKYSNIVKVLYGLSGKPAIISPSVTSNEVTVSFTGNLFSQVIITDYAGRTVLTERLATNNQRINVSKLAAGQYVMTLVGNTEKVSEKLLIVR